MSIFSRTRDIIAANVIDLVNRSDDPAKMIRVIILEMEETLVEVRASAARSIEVGEVDHLLAPLNLVNFHAQQGLQGSCQTAFVAEISRF